MYQNSGGLGDFLAIGEDGLNLFKCEDDDKAISEGNSDRSTCTAAAPSRVSPRRSSATSTAKCEDKKHAAVSKKSSIFDEEEEDLLVASGPCFNSFDAEMLSNFCCLDKEAASKSTEGKRVTKRSSNLALKLDYDSAVLSINKVLDSDRTVPGHMEKKLKLKVPGKKGSNDSCESSPSVARYDFDAQQIQV